jgi:hypothetical protein
MMELRPQTAVKQGTGNREQRDKGTGKKRRPNPENWYKIKNDDVLQNDGVKASNCSKTGNREQGTGNKGTREQGKNAARTLKTGTE